MPTKYGGFGINDATHSEYNGSIDQALGAALDAHDAGAENVLIVDSGNTVGEYDVFDDRPSASQSTSDNTDSQT